MNTNQNAVVAANNIGAMAHAMIEAEKSKTIDKEEVIKGMGHPPMIVPRVDLLGQKGIFLAGTHNREANTIQFWDGKKGSKAREVSIEYYKSTKPLENVEERNKLVQDFSREFRVSEVILRQRLLKESVMRKADASVPGDEKASQKEFADKLLASIHKAVYEALALN